MFNRNNQPIKVVVKDGRWDAFAQIPPTRRDHWLLALIEQQGGINEKCPDGEYYFNARRVGLFKVELDLTPIED